MVLNNYLFFIIKHPLKIFHMINIYLSVDIMIHFRYS